MKEQCNFMFVGNLWIFFVLIVTQIAFKSQFISLKTPLLQGDQQTNILLIFMGKIHMMMI